MRRAASNWLKPEREVVLSFTKVEGFDRTKWRWILGQPENRVQELIASLHQRLRMEALPGQALGVNAEKILKLR